VGFSENDGIFGRAQEGCTCHATLPSANVTALLEGVPANYEPGQVYTLSINVSGGPAPAAGRAQGGFGLKVTAGSVQAADARELASGVEATHTVEGNKARGWSVFWTAPEASAGRVTFWLSTNAVNGDNTTKKDEWNQLVSYSDPPGVEPPPNHPPDAVAVDGPLDVLLGYPNAYLANATDLDGDSLRFSWSFGDGTPAQVGRRVNHVFTVEGVHLATLTVADVRGAAVNVSFEVRAAVPAEPLPPTTLEYSHSLSDGVVQLGAALEIACQVRNVGDFPVTSVIVHLHHLAGDEASVRHQTIAILMPNQTKVVRHVWTPEEPGSYVLVVEGRGAEALGAPSDPLTVLVLVSARTVWDTQLGFLSLALAGAVAWAGLRRYRP